jgi:hypothetical protein
MPKDMDTGKAIGRIKELLTSGGNAEIWDTMIQSQRSNDPGIVFKKAKGEGKDETVEFKHPIAVSFQRTIELAGERFGWEAVFRVYSLGLQRGPVDRAFRWKDEEFVRKTRARKIAGQVKELDPAVLEAINKLLSADPGKLIELANKI